MRAKILLMTMCLCLAFGQDEESTCKRIDIPGYRTFWDKEFQSCVHAMSSDAFHQAFTSVGDYPATVPCPYNFLCELGEEVFCPGVTVKTSEKYVCMVVAVADYM